MGLTTRKTEKDYVTLAEKANIEYVGPLPKNTNFKTYWKCICKNIFERSYNDIRKLHIICPKCIKTHIGSKNFKGYKDIHLKFFNSIKAGAETRNLTFNITIEYISDLLNLQNYKCCLSGQEIFLRKIGALTTSTDSTASLDRIDSTKGYVEGNCQWVHKNINKMKNNLDQDYFIEMCKKVAENFK